MSVLLLLSLLLMAALPPGVAGAVEPAKETPRIVMPQAVFATAPGATVRVEVKAPERAFVNNRRQLLAARGTDTAANGWNLSWVSAENRPMLAQRLLFHLAFPGKRYLRYAVPVRMKPDTWTEFTVTLDGKNIRFYQDGALLDTRECPAKLPDAGYRLQLGRYPLNGNPMPFAGTVRLLEVLPEVRTPADRGAVVEVPELYYRNFDLADRDEPVPAGAPFAITPEQAALARRNIANSEWGKEVQRDLFRNAEALLRIADGDLAWHIPELPGSDCSCPKCGQPSNVAWNPAAGSNGEKLVCAGCRTTFPHPDFPEDKVLELKLDNGMVRRIPYFEGKSLRLNEGNRYFISGVMRSVRVRNVMNRLPSLTAAWVLTGEKRYVEGIRKILLRLADVYPGYPARLRNTYYPRYGGNPIEGKFYRWKLGDNQYMIPLATAYDVARQSGVFSPRDKVLIENRLFREYKRMMCAYPPWRDLTNSMPFGYAAMAYVGRVLGDHEMIAWVVRGPQSLERFMAAWFHRDGFWHENTCSYQSMTLGFMHRILEALEGYSDPASYRGPDRFDRFRAAENLPMLGKAYLAMAAVLMPDGRLPGLNDSVAAFAYNPRYPELAVRYFDSPAAREVLAFCGGDGVPGVPGIEALFTFDPERMSTPKVGELPDFLRQSRMIVGPRWMILRGGHGPDGSALVLDYGEQYLYHVHTSALNFLYFDYGRELATDIGYLSAQHLDTAFNKSIMAHLTVMVNDAPHYRGPGRRVESDFFAGHTPTFQAVRGHAPNVAPQTEKFERTQIFVNRGPGDRYVADFFEARAGKSPTYIFHGGGEDFRRGDLAATPCDPSRFGGAATGANRLTDGVSGRVEGPHDFSWIEKDGSGTGLLFRLPRGTGGTFITARAPGNRNLRDPLSQRKMHVLLLRDFAPENFFCGLIEGFQNTPRPRQVALLAAENARVLEVRTGEKVELLISSDGKAPIRVGQYPALGGRMEAGAVMLEKGVPRQLFVVGGSIRYAERALDAPVVEGTLTDCDPGRRTLMLSCSLPSTVKAGSYLVFPAHRDGFFRIEAIDGARVTVSDTAPWPLRKGDRFRIVPAREETF